jgi:hypothetical protein
VQLGQPGRVAYFVGERLRERDSSCLVFFYLGMNGHDLSYTRIEEPGRN